MKTLSLIVPVFNEQEVLRTSYERMKATMESLDYGYEIIYVNDGSRDDTLVQLREIAAQDKNVRVRSFSRNFGHQLAVTAGMDIAKGDALIIIDADLQDPPEVIPELVKAWENGADIAYGKRAKREGETFMKKFTAACYYRLLSFMSAYPIPLDTGDFRLIDRKVADMFLQMREHNRFLRGMSAWMGFNAVPVGQAPFDIDRIGHRHMLHSRARTYRTYRMRYSDRRPLMAVGSRRNRNAAGNHNASHGHTGCLYEQDVRRAQGPSLVHNR